MDRSILNRSKFFEKEYKDCYIPEGEFGNGNISPIYKFFDEVDEMEEKEYESLLPYLIDAYIKLL